MKILLISPRYLPIFNKDERGAIEKLERIYLRFNERTNDHFTVYSPKIASNDYDNPKLINSNFRNIDETTVRYKMAKYYHALKRRILRRPNSELYIRIIAKDILRRREQNEYDLIIFENGEQDIPIFKKITKTKTRIALHLHNDYINKETKNGEAILNSVNEVWVVSGFLAKQIRSIKQTKIIIVPNAIDTGEIAKSNADKTKSLARKYRTNDNKIFLFVGRILKVKGILQLLEAFDKYNTTDEPQSKLLVIGPTEHNLEGVTLKRILGKYCARNSNIQYLGYLRPNEVTNHEAIADCQIIPSMWEEAFGLVILEAMASNLKIIASKSGGIPEIGKNKISYVNRDNIVEELISSMKRINKQEELPPEYYKDILDEYTIDNFNKNIYKAIHENK